MERRRIIKNMLVLILASILLFAGCKNSPTEPVNSDPSTNQEVMLKLADEDSSLASFDTNYNEDDLMSFMKINTAISPKRVGVKVHLVNRTLSTNVMNDTAIGTLTKNYEGVLLIAASYDSTNPGTDTVLSKPFISIITRKLIFVKVAHTNYPLKNWRIGAISLPEGGVLTPNINISKVTVYLPGGDTLMITSPNDYFLARGWGWWRQLPIVSRDRDVKVQVEVFSAYSDDDFVTLTYGADLKGFHRAKHEFNLVSSVPVAGGYDKVYEQTYNSNQFPGYYHAIINAFPHQVIFDDATPVENELWGIPYIVKF